MSGQANVAAFPDSPAMREYAQKHQENAAAVEKATSATNSATSSINRCNNISPAANSAAGSLNTLASKISSVQMPSIAVPGATPAPTPHHAQLAPRSVLWLSLAVFIGLS